MRAPSGTGPVASAHQAQRRHTGALFAENTQSSPIGANGARRPAHGPLLDAHGHVRYSQTCRGICRTPCVPQAASFAKKAKSSLVDPDGTSHPHPSAMPIRHACVKWNRTRRKRPPCTAAPHEGLIRRNRKIVSVRRQWSQPPGSWHFASTRCVSQVEPDPSQVPAMHSGATRGPYSPKPQNRFRSTTMEPAARLMALCW